MLSCKLVFGLAGGGHCAMSSPYLDSHANRVQEMQWLENPVMEKLSNIVQMLSQFLTEDQALRPMAWATWFFWSLFLKYSCLTILFWWWWMKYAESLQYLVLQMKAVKEWRWCHESCRNSSNRTDQGAKVWDRVVVLTPLAWAHLASF